MKKYVIEREIPKIETLDQKQLAEAARKSNEVLRQLGRIFSGSNLYYCRQNVLRVSGRG